MVEKVSEFHEIFNVPILDTPQIPSKERASLRVSLLQEELDELKKAIEDNDLVEVADALCDLQYVLSGAVLEFGLGEKFVELFNEVHESNMSKTCDNERQAKETVDLYSEKGVETYYESVVDSKGFKKYNIYRKLDQKVLKNKDYKPVNLIKILEK